MSILSWVTSILGLAKIPEIGVARDVYKPATLDDGGNGEHFMWNDGHRGREDYSKLEKDAKNDDGPTQKAYCDPELSDDCGESETYPNPGEALARFDFSHDDFGSRGPDHSGDMQAALASMSSDDALEYAIGQMGAADQFDIGHFHVPADTSHDTDA